MIYSLIADHGTQVAGWLVGILALVGAWALTRLSLAAKWRALITELGMMARDAVLEVWQVYVEAIKAGRADGKLTDEETRAARKMAVDALRVRLGWRKLAQLGGGMLMRIFAGSTWAERLNSWLVGAVETQVAAAKLAGKSAGLVTTGTAVSETPPVPQ